MTLDVISKAALSKRTGSYQWLHQHHADILTKKMHGFDWGALAAHMSGQGVRSKSGALTAEIVRQTWYRVVADKERRPKGRRKRRRRSFGRVAGGRHG